MITHFTGRLCNTPNSYWSASDLRQKIQYWRSMFSLELTRIKGLQAIGILADNSSDWIAIDLAAAELDLPLVPFPSFFTDAQLLHLVEEAQVGLLITDQTERIQALGFTSTSHDPSSSLQVMNRSCKDVNLLPKGIHKITFTSGTTGTPKGVCLNTAQQRQVAQSLKLATKSLNIKTHLCLLPLSVLLENIAGIYAPMLANATIACPPLREVGLIGSSQFDAQQCLRAIEQFQAESIILLPQMLHAILHELRPHDPRIQSLKFVAVGGGKVPSILLKQAQQMKLPVYEGYGLSECASVVCLNTPEQHKMLSVGKPIQGVEIRVDEQQEVWVKGRGFKGYLHELKSGKTHALDAQTWFPTGDLGSLSEDGFLNIHGRKKNLIITSFGRNISPEWPESVLLSSGAFAQAIVFGEAQPTLGAVLVPFPSCTAEHIQTAIRWVNQQLPDYATIKRHIIAEAAFTPSNGLSTANGRIKREAVFARYVQHLCPSHQEPI